MTFFKMFSSFLDSPKVMGLGLDGIGFWVTCLGIANRSPRRGTLPKVDEIAFMVRVPEDRAGEYLARMVERRLLVACPDGTFAVHDWEVYQAKTDAERQRDKRDRDRTKRDGGDGSPVGNKPSRDVTDRHAESRTVPNVTKERRGDKSREEPPLPPLAGERACVLIEDEDAEPFDGGGYEPAPAPPPAVRNQPATVERVAANAESLFPCLDFGAKVRQLQRSYDLDVLEAAMIDAHGAGKTSWRYVEGIYRNRMADGRGAAVVRLAAQTRARPDPVRPKFGVAELDKQIADHEARVLAGLRANAR